MPLKGGWTNLWGENTSWVTSHGGYLQPLDFRSRMPDADEGTRIQVSCFMSSLKYLEGHREMQETGLDGLWLDPARLFCRAWPRSWNRYLSFPSQTLASFSTTPFTETKLIPSCPYQFSELANAGVRG